MSDLISRQAAINKCQERLYESALNNVGYECKSDEVFADIAQNRIKIWLNEVQSAEPKRGEWIVKENHGTGWYRITCSECGEDVTATAPCIGFMPIVKVLWNYCPECGAKMDGERKEGE